VREAHDRGGGLLPIIWQAHLHHLQRLNCHGSAEAQATSLLEILEENS
jgi:hypothetical protein